MSYWAYDKRTKNLYIDLNKYPHQHFPWAKKEMKNTFANVNLNEDLDKPISENKRRIRLLNDINTLLIAKKSQITKIKSQLKETEELGKELKETQQKANNGWNEKIQIEQIKTHKLETEWKHLVSEIEANAETPGYQQAIKHTDVQLGQHKHDGPSSRTNYKNMASRLQNEIKTLQQRVNASRLNLINEIKKKTAVEEEVREIRATCTSQKRSLTPSKLTSSIPDLNLQTAARVN